MPSLDTITILLQEYGYFFLFPVAVAEGPIVTVIAAFLASLELFHVAIVYVVVVAADLFGDVIFYVIGRWGGNLPWMARLGLHTARAEQLTKHYETHGGKILVMGKLTHAAGFAVLLAAGAAKMSIGKFLWYNTLATLPKSLAFVLLGYFFGHAYNQVDTYLEKGSLVIFLLLCCVGAYSIYYHKRSAPNPTTNEKR
ncbi:MAG: hypothetical protein A2542_00640 [Parcubacteria group bacterium RIFOXYD2_FULL_52_8]|nr:MAG: hypothetical protein A2542_00640 [Parcubacteria group bacterium RIFOXYD2_FULL_52_8]